MQRKGTKYNWELQSYFEKESEQEKNIDAVLLEDELWNRIRLNPSSLQQGQVSILPGLLWQRLSHSEMQEQDAVLTLSKADTLFNNDPTAQMYTIHYLTLKRTLKIYFQSTFPHEILGWKETYPDGLGNNKKMLTTTAVKKKTIWLDYWQYNKNADSIYVDSLQLMHHE